jgi:hypothetical protein
MQKIELYTKLLEYVATVEIPTFDRNPEVVLWGVRHFRALGHPVVSERDQLSGAAQTKPVAYIECFAYASMTESPGLPRWEPPPPVPVNRNAREVVGKAVAPGEPDTATRADGQQLGYVVLSDAERAKGFVRPVRNEYVHVGRAICGNEPPAPPAGLEEGYVAWLCNLTPGHKPTDGCAYKAVRESELKNFKKNGTLSGCGSTTSMGRELAETYARDPEFYNGTYCSKCKGHFRVGKDGEFVWYGDVTIRVGT